MFVFDIGMMLGIIFFANILPGIIAGLAILKKVDQLEFIEKVCIGAAMGFLFPQLIPFLLSFLGIQYTYTITILSIAVTYILAFVLFFLTFKMEDFKDVKILSFKSVPRLFTFALIILLFFTFSVRLQTISPLYMELDPYFYSYGAIYILEDGSVPLHDSTAWWPENSSSHRAMPSLIYLESNWYSLYMHGNMASVDSYLLAEISSFYPPIAAMFTIFFVYLLFKIGFNKEIGLAIAALLSFMPSYLYKTLSGVFEAQPMSFLLYAAMLALVYAFLKYKDKKLIIPLAIISFSAMLGSSGYMITSILISMGLASLIILNFIKYWIHDGKDESLKQNNEDYLFISLILAILFVLFCFTGRYYSNSGSMISMILDIVQNTVFVFIPLVIAAILKLVYDKNDLFIEMKKKQYLIYGVVIIAFLVFMASPFGSMVMGYAKQGFGVGNYNNPLERTIAEQQLAGGDLT